MRNIFKITLLTISLLVLFINMNGFAFAQAENPFLKAPPAETQTQQPESGKTDDAGEKVENDKPSAVRTPAPQPQKRNWFMYNIEKLQRTINKSVSSKMRELKHNYSVKFFISIMLLSFAYGILHALGPGHGKSVIGSWILISKKEYKDVLTASVLTAVFHAASAVLIILGSWLFLKNTVLAETTDIKQYLQLGSGIVLLALGIYEFFIFIKHLKEKGKDEEKEESLHTEEHAKPVKPGETKLNSIAVAFTAGIVPCPVTSLIMVFAISMDMVWQGIVFVIAFACGMAAAILGVASAVWKLKENSKKVKIPALNFFIGKIAPVLGALFLIVFAVIIIAASI